MRVASVIVDVPARAIATPFSYAICANLEAQAKVGCAVAVNFGNRPVVGYIAAIEDVKNTSMQLKPLQAVLTKPYFDETAIEIAQYISREYEAPFMEALRLFLPPHGVPKAVRDKESGEWVYKAPEAKPVDDRWVSLVDADFVPKHNAVKQRALIDALREGPLRMAELTAQIGAVNATCKALATKGVLAIESRRRLRGVPKATAKETDVANLTQGQRDALAAINNAINKSDGQTVLLDGVTSSGKTEVYLRTIRRVIDEGGQACVLVPEISLTPQTVGRFRGRFGDAVAVLHSRMSIGERYDQWDLIRTGQAKVVVGARSALFAPFGNLKLIVIDEEHEFTFKQESSPRYLARNVAREMARVRNATVVLGSATPSFEALYDSTITRVEMPERAGAGQVPSVEVVDMAQEFNSGNRSMFSRRLQEQLQQTLLRKEKAVLFLNRRGFASFLLCRECGYTPECPNCSVSFTYHEYSNKLECHHCDTSAPVPSVCPECGSPYLRKFGAGTERVEAELRELVGPDIPIIRMDADTTTKKFAHEKLLEEFDAAETGILLGTQMIAKGLDYPKVTLVGVINADTTLNLPDFRASERSYQLLEQVSGRAGRGDLPGTVIIQTYSAAHPAILAVAKHDRSILTSYEMPLREELFYPPFSRLVNILISSENEADVKSTALEIAIALQNGLPDAWKLLGPSPCVLSKLKAIYRRHILLKAPLYADIPAVLDSIMASCKAKDGVRVVLDVDPLNLM